MKCSKCKSEIKVGSLYCATCGKEAQFVSETQLLEEEYLNNILKDKPKENVEKKNQPVKKNKKKTRKKVFVIIGLLALILTVTLSFFVIKYNLDHSFRYQYKKGVICAEEGKNEKAVDYFKKALKLDSSSIKTRMKLADTYLVLKKYDDAIEILLEIISLDSNYEPAFQYLINIYEDKKDYDAIIALVDYTSNDRIQNLLLKYMPSPPIFDKEEGKYTEFISIELKGEKHHKVFYTLDGSSPTTNGKEYKEPIQLESGVFEIKAVAYNKYNVASEEIKRHYTVELQKPRMPRVTPDSGSFNSKQSVEIEVPEGCSVYYVWADTTPDEKCEKYIYPLQIPEGNNILSIILVDKYGLKSDVLKCNYIYLPVE